MNRLSSRPNAATAAHHGSARPMRPRCVAPNPLRVLEAVAERAVEADVRAPDQPAASAAGASPREPSASSATGPMYECAALYAQRPRAARPGSRGRTDRAAGTASRRRPSRRRAAHRRRRPRQARPGLRAAARAHAAGSAAPGDATGSAPVGPPRRAALKRAARPEWGRRSDTKCTQPGASMSDLSSGGRAP